MALPPFPVDDITLDLLDHACRGALNDEGGVAGADMTVTQLLDFLSGPSETEAVGSIDVTVPIYVRDEPAYSETDVIQALIAKIRTLQKEPHA
ncbi:hypothetical protein [Gordonia sp. (in: high G+C Gram-positive bacteria)]|uniref:hypothetical protein n=1 Tax=Gordonia sp. (in: high G+C Gram-positive bacteria) TaxID=84139 RepID=UPI00334213F0